jgi:putative sterol carrier protein
MEVEKMSQRIMITDAKIEKNELLLQTDSAEIAGLAATGQMLVDSDQLAFIYIVENEGGYQYISIPQNTWNEIHEGLMAGAQAFAASSAGKLKLEGFAEEMEYLITNIKGNSNYGEEMVTKVEQIFTAPSA